MDEKKLLAALGAAIRARRKRAGLTIAQLSELAGTDAGFLAYIETGKKSPSLVTAARVAEALQIGLADLFKETPRTGPGTDYKLQQRFHSMVHDRTPRQKAELMAVMKKLRNLERLSALRKIIGK